MINYTYQMTASKNIGQAGDYRTLAEDVYLTVRASDESAMTRVANIIGPNVCPNPDFIFDCDPLAKWLNSDIKVASYDELHTRLERFHRKVQNDLGSIEIVSIAMETERAAENINWMRIEAKEEGRSRVIILTPQTDIMGVDTWEVIETITAKF